MYVYDGGSAVIEDSEISGSKEYHGVYCRGFESATTIRSCKVIVADAVRSYA